MTFHTIEQIKQANRDAGNHFFDPATMRGFGSRVAPGIYGGRVFVTSEQSPPHGAHGSGAPWGGERRYSVRVARPDGTIGNGSEFGEFDSLAQARRAAGILAGRSAVDYLRDAVRALELAAELLRCDEQADERETSDGLSTVTQSLSYGVQDVARKIERETVR